MFIQHLATTTHNVVKTERKPRRNIQYRDVSSAIAKTDNLEFAVDVVPKTLIWKEAKKRREEHEEREKDAVGTKGKKKENGTEKVNGKAKPEEAALNGNEASTSPTPAAVTTEPEVAPDAMEVVEDSEPEEDAAAMQLEMEMRGPPRQKTATPEAQPPPAPVPAPTVTTRRSTGGFTSINGAR
jgi:DNA polymerase epsilon subunit 4